ncbi:hypothetical protein D3C81_1251740 [compost metagenome]
MPAGFRRICSSTNMTTGVAGIKFSFNIFRHISAAKIWPSASKSKRKSDEHVVEVSQEVEEGEPR